MIERIDTQMFINALSSATQCLLSHKQAVNDLNVYPVPDGDTGTNMSLTMQNALKECIGFDAKKLSEAVTASSNGALMGARGNSGVILSQLFRGFARALQGKEYALAEDIAHAMESATEMAYKAVMTPTEGTILTVSRHMSEFAMDNYESIGQDIEALLEQVISRGYESLAETPKLLAALAEAGVVDAGGQGLLYILEGALAALRGEEIKPEPTGSNAQVSEKIPDIQLNIEYAYCTEFLITSKDKSNYESFLIDRLVKLGDSLLVIQDNGYIKVHVHTNEPWTVMRIASACGDFSKIKIDNMREQHEEIFGAEISAINQDPVPYAIISVSSGEGFAKILEDLGVDYIIEGGQTMNPSTQDFLDIIERVNAENFVLLPNNKNIVLAANQAKEISSKNIAVVPTATIPEAIAALMEFNPEAGLEQNTAKMIEAKSTVLTAQVTFAVRESKIGDLVVEKGDSIGLVGKDILFAGKAVDAVAFDAASKLADECELLTIYYGEEVSEQDAQDLQEKVQGIAGGVDVQLFYGGQPLYYYIISAE
ncbi:MAG: DAK2 domain-containing protein [Eubacteriaceae bacterium]|nr:DAK2 domain-containing protein [Eubacteriaceae bacterium]